MKSKYFERVENKYVFNLSRIFWHFFIGIGTLAIIAGIVVLAYSIIPPFKAKVTKPDYPAEIKVTISDLQEQVAPVQAQPDQPAQVQTPAPPSNDPDKPKYDALLNQLQQLIPPSKYSWEGSGHFVYPYGEDQWNFYHNDKYRVFVKTGGGVTDNLNLVFDRINYYTYKNKAALLDAYIAVLKGLNEENRMEWLNNLMNYTNTNKINPVELFSKLGTTVTKFPKENLSYLFSLIDFRQRNANDGIPFIGMVNDLIDSFDRDQRVEILNNLIFAHNSGFNNQVPKQREITQGFIPLAPYFKGEQQPRALARYYRVYTGKNQERARNIADIENEFNMKTMKAELDYKEKQMGKQQLRLQSVMSIAGGIAFVSIIAILLVFLAIQRSVREIEDQLVVKQFAEEK